MKIFCYPYRESYCYQRPDTALMRPDEDFYIPPQCGALRYAPACLVRICKLGRSVDPAFAARYYDQYTMGLCLYDWTTLLEARCQGLPWTAAVALDYSLPSPREFLPLTAPEHWNRSFRLQRLRGGEVLEDLPVSLPAPEELAQKLAHLSQSVYLKMGDLLVLELQEPRPVEAGDFFALDDSTSRRWVDFQIK